jgi:hypothetical protein
MKIIITHSSPDWDAITSVWLLKRFLPGWENANIAFVPAGSRYRNIQYDGKNNDPVEIIDDEEIIHVDTGLGPLDHHQTSDKNTCGASLSLDFVLKKNALFQDQSEKITDRIEALNRLVSVVVDIDHFGEVFWQNPAADYHEFSLLGLLEGLKMQKPNQDSLYINFGMDCLDGELHNFENRIWAEREIKAGKEFETSFGRGIAFETLNDTVIKLSQKMGYVIVVRKDPRKGYVRIKTRPEESGSDKKGIDLTPVYEKLKEMDPKATWFLHVSKKMLLNGTPKNPKMIPSTLSLQEIVDVVKKI